MAVTAGDLAPPFTLDGILGGVRRPFSLAEYAGRPVILAFYPGDATPICTRQLTTYTADIDEFVALDAQVLGFSPDDVDSHERFAADQGGFAFPLLADVDKDVARSYGVLGPLGFYRRSVFVVGSDGRLAWVHRGHAATTFRPTAELVDILRGATG
jgi:peroxiredoxin Q/BCP